MCFLVCSETNITCSDGRIDGEKPACITTAQRCDGITDCIGGDDEQDYNCPCEPEGAVRLVDGMVPYRGRVEFCKRGRWTTMCSQWRYNRYNIATVICRQLGYPSKGADMKYI